MNELIFLGVAAVAAAFKVVAIIIGLVWGYKQLLSAHSVPLSYQHTHVQIPFRPWVKRD